MSDAASACGDVPSTRQRSVSSSIDSDHVLPIDPLVRKLTQFGPLLDSQRRMLEEFPLRIERVKAGQDVLCDYDGSKNCVLLLEGAVFRYRMVADDHRQIMFFHFQGDILDLDTMFLGGRADRICALTSASVALLSHNALREWTRHDPHLTSLLWQDTLVNAAISREWVVNVGRRTAYGRISHLVCEVVIRMRAAGLGTATNGYLPIESGHLADSVGLSPVHVQRVLLQFDRDGLIELCDKTFRVLDLARLKKAAGFDANYLHQFTNAA